VRLGTHDDPAVVAPPRARAELCGALFPNPWEASPHVPRPPLHVAGEFERADFRTFHKKLGLAPRKGDFARAQRGFDVVGRP